MVRKDSYVIFYFVIQFVFIFVLLYFATSSENLKMTHILFAMKYYGGPLWNCVTQHKIIKMLDFPSNIFGQLQHIYFHIRLELEVQLYIVIIYLYIHFFRFCVNFRLGKLRVAFLD